MHSLSSSRQDTQVSSWPHWTCSSNSFPPHPLAFPLVSSLAFTASFLPLVFLYIFSISWAMLAVSISFFNLGFIGCHVFNIRSGHIHFQGQYSLYFFPFVCSIFLVVFFALVVFIFSAFLVIIFLHPLPGFLSYKGVSFPVGLLGRKTAIPRAATFPTYCPHSTTLSFMLQFPSFSISFPWIPWVLHSPASVFSPTLLSGSSGIAVSSCSVLAVCPRFLISVCGVFSFFASYTFFVLRCLVFVLPSFIHANSESEFVLLACCYSRWVFEVRVTINGFILMSQLLFGSCFRCCF